MQSHKINFCFSFPIPEHPFYVLVETHGSDEVHDEEKLTRFLKKEMESGLILDGTVTSEPSKMRVPMHNYYKPYAIRWCFSGSYSLVHDTTYCHRIEL